MQFRMCVCMSVGMLVCLSVAPGSAPVNIAARPISASSVVVHWNEPLIPSGIIKVLHKHLFITYINHKNQYNEPQPNYTLLLLLLHRGP